MMLTDGIVICSESKGQLEESLERWIFALERRKMLELCINERLIGVAVKLQ